MSKPNTQTYLTKTGATQHKPSLKLVMALNAQGQGFCLACAEEVDGIEPDARRYTCPACGQPKVYGAEELFHMNLTY